jgi:hypothetical protein
MMEILLLACLAVVAWGIYAFFRDGQAGSQSPPPLPPPPTLRGNPRFRGRQVASAPTVSRAKSQVSRRRLRNGKKIPAVRNGEVVTPDDAIGLGCLAPISECTLGDRCICLNRHERQVGGL